MLGMMQEKQFFDQHSAITNALLKKSHLKFILCQGVYIQINNDE